MQAPRKITPPRPYNPTTVRPSVKRESTEWEPVSLRDRDVSWELVLDHEDAREVRLAVEDEDEIELPPITSWVDMSLPPPLPRPRESMHPASS